MGEDLVIKTGMLGVTRWWQDVRAGLLGPQLQPWLLLSIPWGCLCLRQWWGRKDTSIPCLPPLAFASRLGLVPSGSSGRAVLHEGPQCWAPWMCLKLLSILTFALVSCPALQQGQLKGCFSLNLGDSLSRGSLVLLTQKISPQQSKAD